MSNITPVCPNCHRMIHTGLIDKEDLISFTELYGDDWKCLYLSGGHLSGTSSFYKTTSYIEEKECAYCGKTYKGKNTSKFCSIKCANKSRMIKVSKEELEEALKKIGSKSGVCKFLHIKYSTLLRYLSEYELSFLPKNHGNTISQSGKNNSNYNNVWIFNNELKKSKLIPKKELVYWESRGWLKGRRIKF